MRTIWKFPFEVDDNIEIEMPAKAKILHVDVQVSINHNQHLIGQPKTFETPCMWAMVVPDNPTEIRKFRLVGTGHPITETVGMRHIGTFKMAQDRLVFHVFEV